MDRESVVMLKGISHSAPVKRLEHEATPKTAREVHEVGHKVHDV
jgi:hypothetical protein